MRNKNKKNKDTQWIWKLAVLEIDYSSMVDMLRNLDAQHSQNTFILSEILELVAQLLMFSIRHTKREQNIVAHELAQLAMCAKYSVVWHEHCPFCVQQLVAQDCSSFIE